MTADRRGRRGPGERNGKGGASGATTDASRGANTAAIDAFAAPVALAAPPPSATDVARLHAGELAEPHALLGVHPGLVDGLAGVTIRAWHPDAMSAECVLPNGATVDMPRQARGLFGVFLPGET